MFRTLLLACVGIYVLVLVQPVFAQTPTLIFSLREISTPETNATSTTIAMYSTGSTERFNVLETHIQFDPTMVTVTGVSIAPSVCSPSFFIDNKINNATGEIYISCGTAIPFTGQNTQLGTISVTQRKLGTTTISFANEQSMYAHDGLGTRWHGTHESVVLVR